MAQKVMKTDRIMIFADNREFASRVVKDLARLDCIVKPKQLEVGDYILSERVCVERKTAPDFLSSVIDQRIFTQLKNLKDSFPKPVLVIEGYDLYSERNVHPNAIRGAMACIAVDYAIPIIWTGGPEETAAMLFWIARREQVDENRNVSIRGQRKVGTLREQQEFLVAGLPGINTKRAKKLLKKFGTPEKVFRASEERLKKVEGIGEIMARNLRKVLGGKYE